MKIIAIVPVMGRLDIIRKTIPRLIRQVDKVIVAGHTNEEALICDGADFYTCPNDMKTGTKWQFCAEKAREYSPDAILIMGSGGMITDDWCERIYPELEEFDMTGSGGIYFLDYQPNSKRMFYWPGYRGGRSREPIGMGRLISSRFLDKINWQIFDRNINKGLDFSTMRIININGGKVNASRFDIIPVLRISSYKYRQHDSYDRLLRHPKAVNIEDIDKFLQTYFPDAL